MRFGLIQRRTVWWPTLWGWLCLLALAAAPALFWFFRGESFLSVTDRVPADVLVIEGWIGDEAVRAAGAEFYRGGYRYVATTGGMTSDRWDRHRYIYAEISADVLFEMGLPRDRVIVASPRETDIQRTFQAATAVWRALQARGIHPAGLNVFTIGPHARRSRLVFAKVFPRGTKVGAISWTPPGSLAEPWWQSSERGEEFLKQTVGYFLEAMTNSGRLSNDPREIAPEASGPS
jgi:hypothetical protein